MMVWVTVAAVVFFRGAESSRVASGLDVAEGKRETFGAGNREVDAAGD